jgi:hypothetical protein
MADSTLADARRMAAEIAANILRLPEVRPSQLPLEAVAATGDLLRACDALIDILAGQPTQPAEADTLLTSLRAHRRLLFLVLAEAAPEQAALQMEEIRDQDRTAEAKMAAGLIPRFFSDPHFEEALREQWLGDAET